MAGILGKKLGMTNIFDAEGYLVPVTVIEAGPCFVLELRTKEKSGYDAIVLGYGDKKPVRTPKPQRVWFEKLKTTPKRFVREIRTLESPACKVGDTLSVNIFKDGDQVDISGKTIGKGFQGGMKRWHWKGGGSGHGSMHHRAPGSIGASSFPSRVHKGKTLPGHMGAVKRTAQNLLVVGADESKNILMVKGSVPGHKGSFLVIRHAKKKVSAKKTGPAPKSNKAAAVKAAKKKK